MGSDDDTTLSYISFTKALQVAYDISAKCSKCTVNIYINNEVSHYVLLSDYASPYFPSNIDNYNMYYNLNIM